jgi:ParB family transcriptional regulator, chromosome partitioning protein
MSRSRGLGRGLSALINDQEMGGAGEEGGVRKVPITMLKPGRFQPRTHFDVEDIQTLADSMRRQGMLQPILARPASGGSDGEFEIVAGERRWRAAQLAPLHEVPVMVHQISDIEAVEIALVENLQREDLRPLEEAGAYKYLHEELGLSHAQIGEAVGRSRSHVSNMLRLMDLPESIQALLDENRLSAGHARALLGAAKPEELAQVVVARDLSVRATEDLVRDRTAAAPARGPGEGDGQTDGKPQDGDMDDLVHRLSKRLGLKVAITGSGKQGRLIFYYRSLDQLDDVVRRFELSAPQPSA